METKNNGKVLIGILIMFVVALSIVGVTYAYFTATFDTNADKEDVKVVAGDLIATYAHGKSLTVRNVVPGWISDGIHYYDVSVAADNGNHIFASKTTDTGVVNETNFHIGEPRMGIAEPIAFTVTNDSVGEHDIYYIIRLNVGANGVYTTWAGLTANDADTVAQKALYNSDRDKLYVALYEGTYEVSDKGLSEKTPVAGPYVLADANTTQVLTTLNADGEPHKLAKGASQSYYIAFGYLNDEGALQIAKNLQITATADIIGVAQDINGRKYNDAIGNEIATTSLMVQSDDNGATAISTTEAAVQAKLVTDLKATYGTQTVWYDADNVPVVFPVAYSASLTATYDVTPLVAINGTPGSLTDGNALEDTAPYVCLTNGEGCDYQATCTLPEGETDKRKTTCTYTKLGS